MLLTQGYKGKVMNLNVPDGIVGQSDTAPVVVEQTPVVVEQRE